MPYMVRLITPGGQTLYGARTAEPVTEAALAARFTSREMAEEALSRLRRRPGFQEYNFEVVEEG